MKSILSSLLVTACTLALHAPVQAADPVKITILYGSRSHGSGAHEFKAGATLLETCFEQHQSAVPVEITTHQNWPADNLDILEQADAIVFYNDATKIVEKGWETIDALAAGGKGLMFMHYAVHPSEENGERYFKRWMGGYFRNGKSVNPFWKAKIKALIGHPTAQGIEEVETIDEFYHSLEFTAEAPVDPIGLATPTKENLATINNLWTETGAATVANNTPVPLVWGVTRPDGGRGAGFTGGHFHHNWAHDELRQLIMNTMLWVAGADVPEGGVPVQPLTEDELNANLDDYGDDTLRLALPTPENRPPFLQNRFLATPEERAAAGGTDWERRRSEIIRSLIVPVSE